MSFHEIEINPQHAKQTKVQVDKVFDRQLQTLMELVRIPGIAWSSFDSANLDKSAEVTADLFRNLNFFDWVEIRKASKPDGSIGAPAVIARRTGAADAPHVLLYAHHDVQPPGAEKDWKTSPFEPEIIGERLYGRGASDDKSGIVTHLTAIEMLQKMATELRIGVSLFIEGEEEAGSPSFDKFLEENRADLAADLIIVADSGNWDEKTPALTTSLRGLVSLVVEVATMDHAVHSGMFGGPVPDAMTAMIRLLATLHDERGDVAVAGLASAEVQELPYGEPELRRDSGLLPGVDRIGSKSILRQNWGEPAITVIGIDNPSVAVSSNTLQPKVRAKISMRIAPHEKPEKALELLKEHLLAKAPFGSKLSFGEVELGPGYLARTSWASKLAKSAMTSAWGVPAVDYGVGGSIPFITKFGELFPDAEVLVTGVEEPDSRAHSPNESQHLPTLKHAMEAETLILLHGNQLVRNRD